MKRDDVSDSTTAQSHATGQTFDAPGDSPSGLVADQAVSASERVVPGDGLADEPSYCLEHTWKCCEWNPGGSFAGELYLILGCKCKNWFCAKCCIRLGLQLRDRLVPVLKSFRHIAMITLTVDPSLFPSPSDAFQHERKNRLVNRLVKQLFSFGHLITRRYFTVVEWQKHTEMAHYHMLVESPFIPHGRLRDVWDSFRPSWCPPATEDRPGLGRVFVSVPHIGDADHAAFYATKYLLKTPAHGYPKWVLSSNRIPRYRKSHGFWSSAGSIESSRETVDKRAWWLQRPSKKRRSPRKSKPTISDRIASCCEQGIGLQKFIVEDENGDIVSEKVLGFKPLRVSFAEARQRFDVADTDTAFWATYDELIED